MAFTGVRDPSFSRPSKRQDRVEERRVDQRLIVTYMTATGARRTLALPRRFVYGALAALACSTVWSIASAFWMLVSLTSAALVAYAPVSASVPAPTAAMPVAPAPLVAPLEAASATKSAVLGVGSDVIAATSPEDVAVTATQVDVPPMTPAVAVTGFHVDRVGRAIIASFNVENRGKGAATGRVWGVATFTTETDETVAVASHGGINPKVPSVAAEGGVTFSARVRTAKELSFHVPAGAKDVASIAVYVGSAKTAQPLVATYEPDQSSGGAVWR